ncbi:heavy metal transporter [Streptomyces sp. NPDC059578]|uniref:heavy metal transporter n=1 Tax=unclassified Streptomyces TaxID=2593676 RepID=UPI0036618774
MRRRRVHRAGRRGIALAVLLAVSGYVVVHQLNGARGGALCTVVSGNGDGAAYRFSSEQAVNAATVAAVGTARGMPERAVTIALATALQESGLRNIDHGDRDSIGLFQQRPSQGWGTAEQIGDPVYSSAEFYEHLEQVAGYSRLPLTVAAQRVQRSGYPQAYAKHEPDATLLAAALTGRSEATLTCEDGGVRVAGSAAGVRAALVRDFGQEVLTPAGAEVSRTPDGEDGGTASAAPVPAPAPGGREVLLPVSRGPGGEPGNRQRGWELAHWAVANSAALGIEEVTYAGLRWTPGTAPGQWPVTRGATGSGVDTTAERVRIVTGQ